MEDAQTDYSVYHATDYDIGSYNETIKQERGVFTNNWDRFRRRYHFTGEPVKAKVWLNKHHMETILPGFSPGRILHQTGFADCARGQSADIIQCLSSHDHATLLRRWRGHAPNATITDHKLHLVVIEKPNFFKLMWLAFVSYLSVI